MHSGIPFTVTLPTNGDGSLAGTWFPNRVGSGRLSHPTIQQWFDPTAFVQPNYGTYGNEGRNILYGPGWSQLDASLQKHWALPFFGGDTGNLQVRVDATDVLSNANFANPSGVLIAPIEGQTTFTAPPITGANTSRALQFEAKFSF